ncbi:MAG: hypothetical protein KTR32_06460 [Granulosicoccus sp.]|nr:hypothetical protein [Granulosicoccus sp.]
MQSKLYSSAPRLFDDNHFMCDLADISNRIGAINPRDYDKSRNYLQGSVSWLSPFTTHGICNTQQIAHTLLQNHDARQCYRFLFELGWREFFHRTWQIHGDAIFDDLQRPQSGACYEQLPKAVLHADTRINIIDQCLRELYQSGLMHNHARMWVAAIVCNLAQTHWLGAARWFHYHLLDGDLASNSLSWQWIAGTFSHKRYVANQANIDKYSHSEQHGSWLDVSYETLNEALNSKQIPERLIERGTVILDSELPGVPVKPLKGPVALRSIWQLDPRWQSDKKQQVVFIDTRWHEQWPLSNRRWRFIGHWAKACNATIYHGTPEQLLLNSQKAELIREEHPACRDWPGKVIERQWLYPMPEKPFTSFSQYFKQVKQHVGL